MLRSATGVKNTSAELKEEKKFFWEIIEWKNTVQKKIIAYFGDALGDFPEDEKYKFGVNNFIFPNPMYGKW